MKNLSVLLIIPLLLITACGSVDTIGVDPTARPYTPEVFEGGEGDGSVPLVGNPEAGLVVFQKNCGGCHAIEEGAEIVGPSLFAAGTRLDYDQVKESIIYPEAHNAFLESEHAAVDVDMPTDFAGYLSAQQLEDLIAYVMSLK